MEISPPTPRTSNTGGAPPEPVSSSASPSDDAPKPTATTTTSSTTELPSNRFELELEFIQCLASPAYLHHLATSNILSSPSFLAYLKYLRYWKRPEYVRFITYPHCLYFLELILENETFRREMGNVGFRNFVHEQQFYSWQFRAERLYGRGAKKVNVNSMGALSPEGNAAATAGGEELPGGINADQPESRMSLGSTKSAD